MISHVSMGQMNVSDDVSDKCQDFFFFCSSLCFSWSFALPWWLRGYSICLQCGGPGFDPWVRKIPWRRKWQPTPVVLPGESHGQRSLVSYNPRGRKDMTERRQLYTLYHIASKLVVYKTLLLVLKFMHDYK